ncbi:hypothetical protein MW7_003195 [Imbroritus primus]|uniref:Uncharacterized protein n=1 Tax=Imbroritus primus TaxID=3058603 RepID=A0ACD3SSS2_9BURK|nr:hypothetical protein MW7_003195 [Burkholderiaceae bacterium PBA]
MKLSNLRAIPMVAGALLLSACAQNYHTKVADTAQHWTSGNVEGALAAHDKAYADVKPADRDLLYYLERGELLRSSEKNLADSTEAWQQANNQLQTWEDDTRTNLTKGAGELGALLLSDGFRRYEGQDYEKVMLSTRLAGNHLTAGNWNDARVEIRKMYERETLIAQFREKEVDALKAAAEEKGSQAGTVKMEQIKGYPVEIFDDPEVTSLRNAYQSAVSHYLAGFVFEALNEPSLAAAGYRQAIELRPDVPVLKAGLERIGAKRRPAAGTTDVLFMVESGTMPARDTVKITLPVPIGAGIKLLTAAYPVIRPSTDKFVPATLDVGGKSVPVAMVTNLDAMARRALRDEMPAAIARSTVRMVVSGVAQEALERQGGLAGTLMSLAVGVASAATADTDTRQWRTLPSRISLARTTVKSGTHTVAYATPSGIVKTDITVEGPYAVVVLRSIGPTLMAMTSKHDGTLIAAAPAAPAAAEKTKAAPRTRAARTVARKADGTK